MKTPIVLGSLFLLITACNPKPKSASSTSAAVAPKEDEVVVEASFAPVVRVMNYNQFNSTLSKLTGINQSKVSALFEEIKGSMPADGDIKAMTSFNLVAKARLADAYCTMYVNGERNGSGGLVPGGVPMLADSLVSNDDAIKNHLLSKFLDYDSSNSVFDGLVAEVDNVLSNSDGQGGVLIGATNLSSTQLNRNLSVMACITILASSHITLIE